MLLLRNATLSDLEAIYQLAIDSGIGLTTLPQNIELLRTRLLLAITSFQTTPLSPQSEYYFFVLEDPNTHQVVGTSAIVASIGHDLPFYTYKVVNRTRLSHELGIRREQTLLHLVNDHQGKSELCTLYLQPSFRHAHHSALLSRGRFLFIAQHPSRFESKIIAEMRGVCDENGNSPFWDGVGQHFFKMPFHQADELTLSTNKQFISDLISEYPIDAQLLSQKAQSVIGKPHPETLPAMHILLNEGFYNTHDVDIFDAGPIIEAICADIHTIKISQTAEVIRIDKPTSQTSCILSNTLVNFRATVAKIEIHSTGVVIDKETAELLQLNKGDVVRFSALTVPKREVI